MIRGGSAFNGDQGTTLAALWMHPGQWRLVKALSYVEWGGMGTGELRWGGVEGNL